MKVWLLGLGQQIGPFAGSGPCLLNVQKTNSGEIGWTSGHHWLLQKVSLKAGMRGIWESFPKLTADICECDFSIWSCLFIPAAYSSCSVHWMGPHGLAFRIDWSPSQLSPDDFLVFEAAVKSIAMSRSQILYFTYWYWMVVYVSSSYKNKWDLFWQIFRIQPLMVVNC